MDIKAIIIITSPSPNPDRFIPTPGSEWKDGWEFTENFLFAYRTEKNTTVQYCDEIDKIPNNDFPIIIWVNTKKIQDNNLNLKDQLTQIMGRLNCLPEKIRVAYHDVLIDNIPKDLHNVAKPYSLAKGNVSQFQKILKRKDDNYVFDTSASFQDIFSCFFLNLPELFSILQHRIVNLFLSLDMNLQVIYEVSKQSKDEAVEHLKDILKNKNTTFYRQKLADLQFMVAKVQTNNENPKLNCDTEPSKDELVKPKIKEDDLPDNNSILDLIPEDKKEKVKEEWENLLKLSGIGLKENKNKSDIFDKNSLEPKFNSPIFLFMRLLDCKIVKYCKDEKSININDVNEILDAEPLKKLLEEIGFHSFFLNPFSHWYNFLNSYLDKLREKIVKEEEKSRKIG